MTTIFFGLADIDVSVGLKSTIAEPTVYLEEELSMALRSRKTTLTPALVTAMLLVSGFSGTAAAHAQNPVVPDPTDAASPVVGNPADQFPGVPPNDNGETPPGVAPADPAPADTEGPVTPAPDDTPAAADTGVPAAPGPPAPAVVQRPAPPAAVLLPAAEPAAELPAPEEPAADNGPGPAAPTASPEPAPSPVRTAEVSAKPDELPAVVQSQSQAAVTVDRGSPVAVQAFTVLILLGLGMAYFRFLGSERPSGTSRPGKS